MVTPLHDRDGFYKYYSAEVAKLVLESNTRKWSTPHEFNDPFDNQFELAFEDPTPELAADNLRLFQEMIRSPTPLKPNQVGPLTTHIEYIRRIHAANPTFEYTESDLAYLLEGEMEGMQKLTKESPTYDAQIRQLMADTSIFCLSEERDNILLWSHYGRDHTGVAIKFLALPSVDSPLILAEPVRYAKAVPRLKYSSLLDFEAARDELIRTITLTKSEVWAHEREWRIVAGLRDKAQTHEIIGFAPQEIGEVYLGCKISQADRNDIVDIVRRKYTDAKIYQAHRHKYEFSLVFQKLI